eukprot:CAMPEP_0181129960 /NCGR_PEP_ID=MMETSP1071-20121207/29603_1 /TAXON_ID=35127 /ORGANISM="Thalassiosira sp., Strain NH16" /LENGTH=579 /DNA_ID=CAMNT_0023215987 /DNA_START=181 /DNA_END=1920 /DNA_ORIENTATION=-
MKFSARKPSLSRIRGISRENKKGGKAGAAPTRVASAQQSATASVVAEAEATLALIRTDTRDDDIVGHVRHDPSAEEDGGGERRQDDAGTDPTTAADARTCRTAMVATNGLAADDRGGQQVDQEKDGMEEEDEAHPPFPKVLFASGSALETYEADDRTDDTNTALASHDETSAGETSATDEEEDSKVKAVVAAGEVGTDAVDADVVLAGAGAETSSTFRGAVLDEGTGTDTDDAEEPQNYVQELIQELVGEGMEGGNDKKEHATKASTTSGWSLPCCDPICFGSLHNDNDLNVIVNKEAGDGRIEAGEAGSRQVTAEGSEIGTGETGLARDENAEEGKDILVAPHPVDRGKEVAEKELRARMELEKKKTKPPPSTEDKEPSNGGDASSRRSRSSRRTAASRTGRLSSILKNNPSVKVSIAKDQFMDTMRAKTSRKANDANRDDMSVAGSLGGKSLSVLGRIRSTSRPRSDARSHDYFQIVIAEDHTDIMVRLPRGRPDLTFKDLRRMIEEGVEDDLPFQDKYKFTVSKGGMAVSRRQEVEWRVRDYDLTKGQGGRDGSYKNPYRVYIKEDTNKKESLCSM